MKNPVKIMAMALHSSIFLYVVILFLLAKSTGEDWTLTWRIYPEHHLLMGALVALSFTSTALSLFMKPLLVRMALAESIAVYGFVAAFLNQSFILVLPFAIWALVLQVYVGPWIIKDNSSS